MIEKKDIVCITVLYNPTIKVVKNIKKYYSLFNQVILVDNSPKNNEFLFKDIESKITYIPLEDNTGIAHALNIGIKDSSEPYIITMDQDSVIDKNLLQTYINFLKKNHDFNIGALTPQYQTDRNHIKKKNGSEEVKLSMQSGTLFKRKVFDKIRLFDEKLFLDVVDWEFFLRMRKNGFKLIRLNQAILNHHPAITKEKSFGFMKLKYGVDRPIRYYYQARNLLWTANKYHDKTLYFNLLVKWGKINLLFDNKKEYRKFFKQGIEDAKKERLGKYLSR